MLRDVMDLRSSRSDSGIKKSKHPCFPGFFPVANETHAGPVTGGMTVFRLPETPSETILARFGIMLL